jgi:predicted DNA-binding transcriptional regulator YafY
LDKNESLKGLHFLDPLYQAIIKKIVLKITYKSFTSRNECTFSFHASILKEFNNRWFLVGKRRKTAPITNLALDRITAVDFDFQAEYWEADFNAEKYYKNVVGVTVNSGLQPRKVALKIDHTNAPYVLTKPLHTSQRLINTNEDGSIIIHLFLIENYELHRLLLGFGRGLEVISPERLRNEIKANLKRCLEQYEKAPS